MGSCAHSCAVEGSTNSIKGDVSVLPFRDYLLAWPRNLVRRFAQLPALAVCGPQFPPGSSHHHHELFQDFVPAHQRRSFRFSERSSIVDRGDAMLFMSEQSLHHERLNTGIV